MSENKGKLCSCGFPQSCPIPHEHDQTDREKAIIKHFENRVDGLVKQRKDLLKACKTLRGLIANKVECTKMQLDAAMLSAKIAIAGSK